MPLKPHPTDPDKLIFVKGEYQLTKPWVGLTDKEYEAMAEQHVTNCYFNTLTYAKAIEQALREKNHDN